ncbi:hypothetical protein [Sorangium sp. So ce1153]|uniref:hypothetical protein n=1 Tax=Sorangium sp. So ce1153 TaxID=3133333 RepID=UPI003F5E9E4F
MPGTYDVYASATVAGSMITLAHFPFRIEAPITLEVGGDAPLVAFTELVPDHPEHAASLDFGQIDAPGPVAVTASPVGPAPPPGFMTTVGGAPIVYHSITTQAEFTPPFRVCLSYAQAELTASNETDLRMLRFADSTANGVYDPGWHVMTELDEVEADIEANVLCASTDSLSFFALAQLDHAGQGDADQDGVPGATVTSSELRRRLRPRRGGVVRRPGRDRRAPVVRRDRPRPGVGRRVPPESRRAPARARAEQAQLPVERAREKRRASQARRLLRHALNRAQRHGPPRRRVTKGRSAAPPRRRVSTPPRRHAANGGAGRSPRPVLHRRPNAHRARLPADL